MLLLADYDVVSALGEVPLHLLEVWVAVKGLHIAMRNEKALSLIGRALGTFVRVDQGAVQRKDTIQRIHVIHDVRRRIWARRQFDFSPTVSVLVELQYEKCHGLCMACGFFKHGSGVCDRRLETEAWSLMLSGQVGLDVDCGLVLAPNSPASVAAVSGLGMTYTASVGLSVPEVVVTVDTDHTVEGSVSATNAVLIRPENLAGKPDFELELTAGLTGPGLQVLGPGLNADGTKEDSVTGPGLKRFGPALRFWVFWISTLRLWWSQAQWFGMDLVSSGSKLCGCIIEALSTAWGAADPHPVGFGFISILLVSLDPLGVSSSGATPGVLGWVVVVAARVVVAVLQLCVRLH
ncbi:hypothetical protein RchiOBHm_Chr2g0109311 [Rosa chinensis]|uniref:Zinc knuckle CX2CX4HX4C domain-containing protein n=1 Tax=Rosa chinensis TaxID=74649 RepID=A0A2P6RPG1_ROSCH|nr:hypothetical protein RchiOBHm_Chr2g0109311 [Rosa chinensis]